MLTQPKEKHTETEQSLLLFGPCWIEVGSNSSANVHQQHDLGQVLSTLQALLSSSIN